MFLRLLKDLVWYFQEAEPQVQRKLLASIFPAKLIFKDGNYRTSVLNPALALILQKNNELQKKKTEDMIISENVSGVVARTGIEPATQGFSDPFGVKR
jgi:hypothetical protein